MVFFGCRGFGIGGIGFRVEIKSIPTGDGKPHAHHKRQIMGREVVVAITDGQLHMGPWEHIFYYEFDGRRRKRILVKMIGQ